MDLSMLNAFHFLRPLWLLALLPLWMFVAWLALRAGRDGSWSKVIDSELLPMLQLQGGGRRQTPWWLLGAIWTLTALALAGPSWQQQQSPAFRAPADWIVVLDLSPSMTATDLAPNRITRARYAIEDILNAARDARVSLVAFAGEAHVVAPLTTDVATVRSLLEPLNPDIMPESGDQLAPALHAVARLIQTAASRHAQVLVLSDGVADPAQALQAAQQLKQQGATLHVISVGTTAGAPEPNGEGGFVQDAQGRSVLSKLPVDQLQRIAGAGGGDYLPVNNQRNLIARLQAMHAYQLEQDQSQSQMHVNTWLNGGIWLLPPILLLASLFARRGWL
jgi:Ca-activated chloride channel homolog